MKQFVLVLVALLAGSAFGQQMKKLAPFPSMWNHWNSGFSSAQNGFVVGAMHSAFRTTNGGSSWSPVALPGYLGDPFYSVSFISPTVGFVTGNSATGSIDAYRTTDAGVTWTAMPFPLGGSWYHHDFINPTIGFMGSNGALVRTLDGGNSWPIMSAYPNCPVIYGMDFISQTTGLVGGHQVSTSQDGIFKTLDGGATWLLKFPISVNDVVYLNPTTAIAIVGTTVQRSTDGGDTWLPAGSQISTGIDDLERISDSIVVGVSGKGDIWRTADGGITWNLQWIGEGALPANWSVDFFDALNGKVVGQSNLIYTTSDGGINWKRLNRGASVSWGTIAAFSDDDVLFGGDDGYIQTTYDGGATFDLHLLDPPTFGRSTAISAIGISGAGTAVAAGHWGGLFRTTNGGKSWTNISNAINVDYYPNAIKFTSSLNGWMAGFDYSLGTDLSFRRTRDGGFTWEIVYSANVPGQDVDAYGQYVHLVTTGRPYWRSTDGGTNFTMLGLPLNEGSSPSVSQMSWWGSSGRGYVSGWHGYLARTSDHGSNWVQVGPQRYQFTYLDVLATGPDEVWVCGATQGGGNAEIKRSINGGATWKTWYLPGQFTTPVRMTATKRYVYVAGYRGETWKFDRRSLIGGMR